jgi:hypothetical protein
MALSTQTRPGQAPLHGIIDTNQARPGTTACNFGRKPGQAGPGSARVPGSARPAAVLCSPGSCLRLRGRHAASPAAAGACHLRLLLLLLLLLLVLLVLLLVVMSHWQWRGDSGHHDAVPAVDSAAAAVGGLPFLQQPRYQVHHLYVTQGWAGGARLRGWRRHAIHMPESHDGAAQWIVLADVK